MALIPPWNSDCVVAIGVDGAKGKREWVASAFLYGYFMRTGEEGKSQYAVYLVTNRHVVEDKKKIYIRSNPQAEEPAAEFETNLLRDDGSTVWVGHPRAEVDVAVLRTDFGVLKERGMQVSFFQSDVHAASIERMKEVGVVEGDFAYVLGFPMGLVGGKRNAVIVRSGSIARIRDVLARSNDTFLVDAFVFPGNSGGPVILKPEVVAIDGTASVGQAYL